MKREKVSSMLSTTDDDAWRRSEQDTLRYWAREPDANFSCQASGSGIVVSWREIETYVDDEVLVPVNLFVLSNDLRRESAVRGLSHVKDAKGTRTGYVKVGLKPS